MGSEGVKEGEMSRELSRSKLGWMNKKLEEQLQACSDRVTLFITTAGNYSLVVVDDIESWIF